MQTQGSLQETDLASLLQTMQSERATGTLTLEDGSDSCSMFFLFGHLFHAVSPAGDGEDVVIRALGLARRQLPLRPARQAPRRGDHQVLAGRADRGRRGIRGARGGRGRAGMPRRGGSRRCAPSKARAAARSHGGSEPSIWSPAASVPEAGGEAPTPWTVPAADSGEPSGADAWTPGSRTAETAPAYTPAEYSPTYVPAEPAPVAPVATPPSRAGATGDGSRRRATVVVAVRHGRAARWTRQPVGSLPIPSGHVQYEGLKSAFVDFPRLLRTLRTDRHTGFIRLFSGSSDRRAALP